MSFGPAITATIGADVAPLQAAGPAADAAAGKIAGQIEKKFVGTQAVATALATAFGLNMEKMAEGLARLATGVSEAAEKSWARLVELSDAATATVQRSLEVMRGESQRLVALEVEQGKLLKEREGIYAAAAKAAADYSEVIATINERVGKEKAKQQVVDANAVRLAEIKKRMEEIGLAQETERVRLAQKAGGEEQTRFERSLKGLTTNEQILALSTREYKLQEQITAFKGKGVDLDIIKQQLLQTTAATEAAVQKQKEEGDQRALELDKESEEYQKAHHEQLVLEAKLKTGTLLPAERERLDVLRLQTKEATLQKELAYLLEKPISEWTQQEKERFTTLQRQSKEIETQIALIGKANEETAKAVPIIEGNIAKWEEFKGTITGTGRSDSDLTDRELQRKAAQLRGDIFQRQVASRGAPALVGGSGYDALLAPQELNLQRTLAELNYRNDVRNTASRFGEQAAFDRYPGLSEQKLAEILRTATDSGTIVSELKTLNRNLTAGRVRVGTVNLDPLGVA